MATMRNRTVGPLAPGADSTTRVVAVNSTSEAPADRIQRPGDPLETATTSADRRATRAGTRLRALLAIVLTTIVTGSAAAIEFGQVDTFDDGTTAGWRKGSPSILPVTNVPDGGPGGAGDNYIRNQSTGTGGADTRQIFYNETQWTGDYNSAGVRAITMMARNLGETTLHLRLAIEGGGGTRFGSATPAILAPNSAWTHVEFDLTGSSLSLIAGSADVVTVLGTVTTLRILSAQVEPAWVGDEIASIVAVDAIRARSSIIPVIEHSWGQVKETFRDQ